MVFTKKILKENFSSSKLEKFVLNDILEDSKNYSGNFKERVQARVNDILKCGCVSGTVSMLIYNVDCKKFYVRFLEDISALIIDLEEQGIEIKNRNNQPIYVFYSWLAYEEIAYRISNFIEE